MAVIYEVNPSTALIRGYDRFFIDLTNWGDTTGVDLNSLTTGPQNFSVAGVAIHPDSEVDACYISSAAGAGSKQIVTLDAPFIGDIPGPWVGYARREQYFSNQYWPTGTVAAAPFGSAMGNDPNGVPIFGGGIPLPNLNYPKLRLIVFLRPPSIIPTTLGSLVDSSAFMIVPAGTTVVRVLAIPGRKRVRAVFKRSVVAGSCDVQLTAMLGGLSGGFAEETFEFSLTSAVTMAVASSEATFDLVVPPNVYFLFIKLKLNAGAPQVGWRLVAY